MRKLLILLVLLIGTMSCVVTDEVPTTEVVLNYGTPYYYQDRLVYYYYNGYYYYPPRYPRYRHPIRPVPRPPKYDGRRDNKPHRRH